MVYVVLAFWALLGWMVYALATTSRGTRNDERERYARSRSLTYEPEAEGLFERSGGSLRGRRDGVDLEIDTFQQQSPFDATAYDTYTRMIARGPRRIDVHVKITRESAIDRFAKEFGAEDVEIGAKRFDEAFVITTTDAERAVKLLRSSLREALLRFPKGATFEYRFGEAKLVWPGYESDAPVLDAALAVGVEACKRRKKKKPDA